MRFSYCLVLVTMMLSASIRCDLPREGTNLPGNSPHYPITQDLPRPGTNPNQGNHYPNITKNIQSLSLDVLENPSIASSRAKIMEEWMRNDPTAALEHAEFMKSKFSLLSLESIEKPFEGIYDLELLCSHSKNEKEDSSKNPCYHVASTMDGKYYQVFFPKNHQLSEVSSIPSLHLTGFILGSTMLISNGNAEIQESWTEAWKNKISGNSKNSIQSYETQAACSRTPNPSTLGAKSILYMIGDFSDLVGYTETSKIASVATQTQQFFALNSFGQSTIDNAVVTPILRMANPVSWYQSQSDYAGALKTGIRTAATNAGYNLTCFDLEVYLFNQLPGINWWGLGAVGAKGTWVTGNLAQKVVAHELGHNWGLLHSSLWVVNDGNSISTAGANNEYGDNYDMMGYGQGNQAHYGALYKTLIKWFTRGVDTLDLPTTSTSNSVVLHPSDQPTSRGNGNKIAVVASLKTRTVPGTKYWLSTKSLYAGQDHKLAIHMESGSSYYPKSYLISMDPTTTSSGTLTNAWLNTGSSFTDCQEAITFTNAGWSPCQENAALKCVNTIVNRVATTNLPLDVTYTASPSTVLTTGVAINTAFTLSATTNGPVGSIISWQLGSSGAFKIGSSVTGSFATSSWQQITVQVTDTTGRQSRRVFALKVGSPTTTQPNYATLGFRSTCAGKVAY